MAFNQVITLPHTKTCPVVCEYAGGHFKVSDKGLTFNGTDKDGQSIASTLDMFTTVWCG
ncbi:hypothetical protein Lsan_1363 [Legionella santicrucis]|uniref:Uncharacterized protein n=1 Tax=Legionella santicrucis TaxID=45074 RepID=A0A0W0Z275_9GAMM|nr:hypothetical protein Lsan_1363 [Legionella santicrucis]